MKTAAAVLIVIVNAPLVFAAQQARPNPNAEPDPSATRCCVRSQRIYFPLLTGTILAPSWALSPGAARMVVPSVTPWAISTRSP